MATTRIGSAGVAFGSGGVAFAVADSYAAYPGGGPVYSPEYTAVKAAIESTGVTLTSTQNTAGNQLIADMIAAGIWAKTTAFYGLRSGTAAACKFNWKNPLDTDAAFRLAGGAGSPGYSPLGVQWDGASYLDSLVNPSVHLPGGSTLAFFTNTPSNAFEWEMGCYNGETNALILSAINNNNGGPTAYNPGPGVTGTHFMPVGHIAVTNSNPASGTDNTTIYHNTDGWVVTQSGTRPNNTIALGWGKVGAKSTRRHGSALIAGYLTQTENNAFCAAITAYHDALDLG